MQFLSSALTSERAQSTLRIITPGRPVHTNIFCQLLNGAYNPDTRYKAPAVINVQ